MVEHFFIELPPFGQGCHLITTLVLDAIGRMPENGLLHLFLQHTSAGLTLNENADPSVRTDMLNGLQRIAPERGVAYLHQEEGKDDMPAHLLSTLTGVSLSIPIVKGRLHLGTWQGIYLCEFRRSGGPRRLVLTVTT